MLVIIAQLLQQLVVVWSQQSCNFTAEEHSYTAAALGAVHDVVDSTTLGGVRADNFNWAGMAFAPTTGMLYCAPYCAASVLVINPLANTTDTTTLGGLGTGVNKWFGIAFAPTTGMLYCAPLSATSVLVINPLTNTTDMTTLGGLETDNLKWFGIVFAPNTGMLYCAPYGATSVLIINPLTNTTDTTALGGLGAGVYKWAGIAFVPTTGMLYCAPHYATSVLVINPLTNTTDTAALGGLPLITAGTPGKWYDIGFAPTTGMLYCAPRGATSVLMINPLTNTTDITTLSVPQSGGDKWIGIALAPTTGMLYCAPNYDVDSVLIINPLTNTTDTTTLGGLTYYTYKWSGIAFAPNTGMLYCSPFAAASVLMIGSFIDSAVLQLFRVISQLRSIISTQNTTIAMIQSDSAAQLSAIGSLQTTVSTQQDTIAALSNAELAQQSTISAQITTIVALQTSNLTQHSTIATLQSSTATSIVELQSSNLAQQSTISAQASTIAALQSDSTSGSTHPLCGNGTTSSNGMCVPDCDVLRRRGVACEPYCDEDPLESSDNGANSRISIVTGVVVGMMLALSVGIVVILHRARKRNKKSQRETLPNHPHMATMYMNPLHQGPNTQFDYEEPVALNPDYIEAMGAAAAIELDDERYVASASLSSSAGKKSQVFYSGVASDDQYDTIDTTTA